MNQSHTFQGINDSERNQDPQDQNELAKDPASNTMPSPAEHCRASAVGPAAP
jgi:hypothetical protein